MKITSEKKRMNKQRLDLSSQKLRKIKIDGKKFFLHEHEEEEEEINSRSTI